ncbi:unnamed protein product, partial [Scytosiphon promiscuus]
SERTSSALLATSQVARPTFGTDSPSTKPAPVRAASCSASRFRMMMIRSATSASAARAVCRRSAGAVAARQQQRTAATSAVGALMCRARTSEASKLGQLEMPPPPRRSFASAVATTFDEGAAGVDASAEEPVHREESGQELQKQQQHQQQQPQAESKPKPRRRRLLRDRPAPITLTDRAAAHLVSLVESKPGKIGVRLGVKRRGCNGMSYTLKYADDKPKGDEEVVVQAVHSLADGAAPSEPRRHEANGGGGGGGGGAISGHSRGGEAAAGEEDGRAAAAAAGGGEVRLFVDPMATLYIAGTVMD